MSKIGTKELELRKMRETIADGEAAEARASKKQKLTEAHKLMLADGLPLALVRTDAPSRKPARDKSAGDPGVTLAPPLAVQKAISADLAEPKDAKISAQKDSPPAAKGKPLTRSQAKRLVHIAQTPKHSPKTPPAPKQAQKTKESPMTKKKATTKAKKADQSKNKAKGQSKKEAVIAMMKKGATMAELTKGTGWSSHSMHGLISGTLRTKMGLKVEVSKNSDGVNVYRI